MRPSRSSTRERSSSLSAREVDGFHSSSTRDDVVFTPCPPGPEARVARNLSSERGMRTVSLTSTGSLGTLGGHARPLAMHAQRRDAATVHRDDLELSARNAHAVADFGDATERSKDEAA